MKTTPTAPLPNPLLEWMRANPPRKRELTPEEKEEAAKLNEQASRKAALARPARVFDGLRVGFRPPFASVETPDEVETGSPVRRWPHYTTDIGYEPSEQDAKKALQACKSECDQALISILWLTGARPVELIKLRAEEVYAEEKPDFYTIKLWSAKKKRKTSEAFVLTDRFLEVPKANEFSQIVWDYARSLKGEQRLFPFSALYVRNHVSHVTHVALGFPLAPYHFRHGVMKRLSRAGASIDELMTWKGAASVLSVSPYLQSRRVGSRINWGAVGMPWKAKGSERTQQEASENGGNASVGSERDRKPAGSDGSASESRAFELGEVKYASAEKTS